MPSLLLQSLTDLLVLCSVHIRSQPLNDHQEQITLIGEGNSDFTLGMEGAWSPFCCHGNVIVGYFRELSDEYNNCTKFQFYTEKVLRDIPLFCDFTSFCVHHVTSQV